MKTIFTAILAAIGLGGCQPSGGAQDKSQFVFAKIPEQIMPIEGGEKYEDLLDAVLRKAGVGEVSGGGSQMSAPDSEGRRTIEWIAIDVDLLNFENGMPILKRELLHLGASAETILEYTRDGKKVEEKLQ